MKNVLRLSVALNLVLVLSGLWLIQGRYRTRPGRVPVHTVPSSRSEGQKAEASPEDLSQNHLTSFRWAQLESTDYRAYIANLRGIGCPERTIRDIITADVHDLYTSRREQLLHGQGPGKSVSLAARLEDLRAEEEAVLSVLLGPGHSQPQPAPEVANASGDREERVQRAPVSMPLAFQAVDSGALKLDEQQLGVLDELRRDFQQEIGGAIQNPNEPAYRQRWGAAQRASDDLLQGLLGGEFYLNYELAAARKASPQRLGGP